ncbi:hypothetical protein [Spirosoma luteum]|uniref:hypothetical protein n=1 Tax=Spirosoma luteum TaxID=431553 RepID=UPI0012F8C864|nr:hypothetical protein [Spirosoma luteum]
MNRTLLLWTLVTLLTGINTETLAQTKPATTSTASSVENEKFVFLNNGATVGMIIKSVLKADRQRLKLTDQQLPKAKEIITNAVVAYNDGVKQLKKTGMNQKKLRTLAVGVETDKVHNYKAILTPQQYAILAAQQMKMYPESKL